MADGCAALQEQKKRIPTRKISHVAKFTRASAHQSLQRITQNDTILPNHSWVVTTLRLTYTSPAQARCACTSAPITGAHHTKLHSTSMPFAGWHHTSADLHQPSTSTMCPYQRTNHWGASHKTTKYYHAIRELASHFFYLHQLSTSTHFKFELKPLCQSHSR